MHRPVHKKKTRRRFSASDLQDRLEQANDKLARRLIETVSPDRCCVRPPLVVVATSPPKRPQTVPSGYLFTIPDASGQVDLVTVREESLSPWRIEQAERFVRERIMDDRERMSGIRLQLSAETAESQVRLYVADPDAFAHLLHSATAYVRTPDALDRNVVIASGLERGDELYPTPPLGCRGRSLLSAYFHAPTAMTFLDLNIKATPVAELILTLKDPSIAERIDPSSIHTGCVPLRNERQTWVNVTVELTRTFQPIPVPEGEVITRIGRVQAFLGNGSWTDCRPWLGGRYRWKHQDDDQPQFVLDREECDNSLRIGLVKPATRLDSQPTHLNIELTLARSDEIAANAAVMGDKGEKASVVSQASPLLMPANIEPIEFETEARATGWLAQPYPADVTEGLRAIIDRAASGAAVAGQRRRALNGDPVAMIREAFARLEGTESFPLVTLELDLHWDRIQTHHGYWFACVLERALPFFCPPLTGTRLILHTPDGDQAWKPRWPAP